MNVEVELDYKEMVPRRGRRDKCLMEIFAKAPGVKDQTLKKLNRVRKHQKAVFLSNIVTASGSRINRSYLCD